MLRHRVIPIVLLDGYSVLKTINFKTRRNLGNPITVAKVYNSRNVDELILLDIDATKQNRSIDLFTIQEVASECFMPLTVGGGLRTVEDIRSALNHGADKVSINSEALKNPEFIRQGAENFGAQCIVVSIDVLKEDGSYKVRTPNGIQEGLDPFEWAQKAEEYGAGELLINSVNHDGEMEGPDIELVERISHLVDIPVIVAGGMSSCEDCLNVVRVGADAVAAASIFHFTSITPMECKEYMHEHGLPVRLSE